MKNFVCFNHQNKADALVRALAPARQQLEINLLGYDEQIASGRQTDIIDFVLTDSDVRKRRKYLEKIRYLGAQLFFVYPHAAQPSLINSIWPAWESTTAHFVVNEYHAEVMRAFGYDKPTINIGWFLCPLGEFKPKRKDILNVLFAPIHPRNAPQDKQANYETMQKLSRLVEKGKINLTVRHIGNLEDNGLQTHKGVIYQTGTKTPAYEAIDNSDVVVSHQTFAWLAVARGVPTVMMATDMPPHISFDGGWEDLKVWGRVVDMFRYPLDILKHKETLDLLHRAAASDKEISDWRRRMIGEEFDPRAFRDMISGYL